jgi:hypothetical protein
MSASVSKTNRISLDDALHLSIHRTLRIPDDGRTYPLPPSLGRLPIRPAAKYEASVVREWRDGTHFLVPVHRQEAVWLQFSGSSSSPRAVKIGVGAVDAVTGSRWDEILRATPQNYIVCPYQPWLDGFKVGSGTVRQFVAVALHTRSTVEYQLTGREIGGIAVACFAPKSAVLEQRRGPPGRRELGVGAGGRIEQRVYRDPFGLETWHATPRAVIRIHLMEAHDYERVTGETAPPSPIDADTYTRFGLPWFKVYDASRGAIPATPRMSGVKSVDQVNRGETDTAKRDAPTPLNEYQIRPIPPRSRDKG